MGGRQAVTAGYVYTGHSLGLTGSIIAAVGIAARLAWMYGRRRRP
jgi:hypothetical protein